MGGSVIWIVRQMAHAASLRGRRCSAVLSALNPSAIEPLGFHKKPHSKNISADAGASPRASSPARPG